MALAHRPRHDGRPRLDRRVTQNPKPFQPRHDLARAISKESSQRDFAIGRLLLGAAAGELCVHPWVRRGGVPGRRRQASTTQWAVNSGSPVRIGAGAGRKRSAHRQAATPIGQLSSTTLDGTLRGTERKGSFEAAEVKGDFRATGARRLRAIPPLARPAPLRWRSLRGSTPLQEKLTQTPHPS